MDSVDAKEDASDIKIMSSVDAEEDISKDETMGSVDTGDEDMSSVNAKEFEDDRAANKNA